jgi:hypothetical protein
VPPRFPGAPEVVETTRSHEPPNLFGLPAGADVGVKFYGGTCSVRLDGRRDSVHVGRFEFAAFASYEAARYAFMRLWREIEKLESPAAVREAADRRG